MLDPPSDRDRRGSGKGSSVPRRLGKGEEQNTRRDPSPGPCEAETGDQKARGKQPSILPRPASSTSSSSIVHRLRPDDQVGVLFLGYALDTLGEASVDGVAVDVLEVLELPRRSGGGLVFSHLPLLVLWASGGGARTECQSNVLRGAVSTTHQDPPRSCSCPSKRHRNLQS